MDIHVLNTFVAVCEYSGFSAAAEKLGYTQSTVSSQIRQLEAELRMGRRCCGMPEASLHPKRKCLLR